MTQDEIIKMAREVGMEQDGDMWFSNLYKTDMDVHISHLEAFAKLVATKEREACAKLADLAMLQNQEAINELDDDEHIAKCFIQGAMTQLVKTAKAIRARGEA